MADGRLGLVLEGDGLVGTDWAAEGAGLDFRFPRVLGLVTVGVAGAVGVEGECDSDWDGGMRFSGSV